MSVRSHRYLVSDRRNDGKSDQSSLQDSNDPNESEYPQNEHPQAKRPRPQKDRRDHDRHLPDKNNKTLLAVREDEWIIFFEDQGNDTQDGKIRQNGKTFPLEDVGILLRIELQDSLSHCR